jgi:hypothetical protein
MPPNSPSRTPDLDGGPVNNTDGDLISEQLPVCSNWRHLPPVFTSNGTDWCDECQDDNRSEMDSQRW